MAGEPFAHRPPAKWLAASVLAGPAGTAVAALLIALVSLWLTGFEFGKNLNVFHIPYVLDFSERPEFASDAFVLSLQDFTSAVWPLVRWLCGHFDAAAVFLAAHALVRFATIYALLLLLRASGLGPAAAAAGAAAIVVAMIVMKASPVGHHELLLDYFTQSIVTWPLLFLLLRYLLLERFRSAAVALALIFDVNAFVAFWMALVALVQRGGRFWRAPARVKGQSVALFLLVCAPVAIWIASSVAHTGVGTPFSYRQFARDYYPNHFLIDVSSAASLGRLLLYVASAWFATCLVPHAAFWRRGLLGLLAVFAAGCVLPYLFDARLVFNLHLLRSDGLIVVLSLVVQAIAFARLLGGSSSAAFRIPVLLVAAGTFAFPSSFLFAIASAAVLLACVAGRHPGLKRRAAWLAGATGRAATLRWLAAGLASAVLLLAGYRASAAVRLHEAPADAGWREMASAIRSGGPAGPYLVPLGAEADAFVIRAERPVWVSWKEGAAVMWRPDFHSQWATRWHAVRVLASDAQILAYAKSQQIPQVVLKGMGPACGDAYRLRQQAGGYRWCSLADQAAPANPR